MDNKNTKLLVSFCNVLPRGLVLGIFDFLNNKFEWLELGENHNTVMGATGICFYNNNYYILTQIGEENKSGLIILNSDFETIKSFTLKKTKDAHDLIPHNDSVLITNTGSNGINKITLNNGQIIEEIFWKYNDDWQDTVHVNSIAEIKNRYFVSIFGNKPKNGWLEAKSGKIIDIKNNSILFENLHHPHSLINIDNELYCLESNTGTIYKFKENFDNQKLIKLDGYIRGITHDSDYFYVGASARRRVSKSKGTLNVPLATEDIHKHSWIYRIDKKTLEVRKRDITIYGSEIFDLYAIQNEYEIPKKINPIIKRLWKFEDEYIELMQKQ